MTLIVPSGVTPWSRTTDFSHYGGDVNKQNYLSRGAIDALCDVDATSFARMTADLAALARVAPFAVVRLLCSDSVPAAPTIEYVNMMTGVRILSYAGDAAPAGLPSGARNGNGDVTLTFASSYTDSYGVLGAYSIGHATADVLHTAVARGVAQIVTANTVRLRAFDATDAALSNARILTEVW